jgi:hypothetical protein
VFHGYAAENGNYHTSIFRERVLLGVMFKTFDRYEPCIDGDTSSEKKVVIDAVEFARTRLRFEPDERQIEVLRSSAKRGIFELYAAVGEVDHCGGEGGASGLYARQEPGAGGESDGSSERGVYSKSTGDGSDVGDPSARGWG